MGPEDEDQLEFDFENPPDDPDAWRDECDDPAREDED